MYDCGSINKRFVALQYSKDMIKQIFKGVDIDLLYVSHFHNDHINLIQEIEKSAKSIKRILLPYLTLPGLIINIADKRVDLDAYSKDLLFRAAGMTENEENKKGFEIKYYRLVNGRKKDLSNKDSLNQDNIGKDKNLVFSGINLFGNILTNFISSIWEYIPYNYNEEDGKDWADLYNRIQKNGIDISNSKQVVKNLNNLRTIYSQRPKNFNEQSTVLFSMPRKDIKIKKTKEHFFCINQNKEDYCNKCKCKNGYNVSKLSEAGCIFFGDYPLDKNDFFTLLNNASNLSNISIGTIQITHHGSKTGLIQNNSFCLYTGRRCVISFAYGNLWNLPKKEVMERIRIEKGMAYCVSNSTAYVQHFEF